ncbi:MAG: hypothetical protein E7345_04100 [Clostridiales bacterium]|nr:hypothetical protein [Clostridiales bacterium]
MENLGISNYFKNEYLTCGSTYDNFIFTNCTNEFLKLAKSSLQTPANLVKPCNITLTHDDEKCLELSLENVKSPIQREIIIRDFATALILREIYKDIPTKAIRLNEINETINSLLFNDLLNIKNNLDKSPMPFEIISAIRKFGKIEVNFYLHDTQNKEIQKAINNYIFSREPYSIKVFTNSSRLPSYTTQRGDFIECPHDYIHINMDKYLKHNELPEM